MVPYCTRYASTENATIGASGSGCHIQVYSCYRLMYGTSIHCKDPALRERNVKVSGLSKVLGGFKRMAGVVREIYR